MDEILAGGVFCLFGVTMMSFLIWAVLEIAKK